MGSSQSSQQHHLTTETIRPDGSSASSVAVKQEPSSSASSSSTWTSLAKTQVAREESPVVKQRTLIDITFSWSLDDIFNDNLYIHKVKKIPKLFESVEKYLDSFKYPLLEETRAELSSKMESLSEAPFAQMISMEKSSEDLFYEVTVDFWRKSDNIGMFRGDVILLVDCKPKTIDDLRQEGCSWSYGYVAETLGEKECDSATRFKVRWSKELQANESNRPFFVIFLMNIARGQRIWDALHFDGNHDLLQEILCTNSSARENCKFCLEETTEIWADTIGLGSRLNESQHKAVISCLCKVQCQHKSNVELICGPPGTGKTRVVSKLLLGLLKLKHRTLMCSATDAVALEVASRVVELERAEHFGNGKSEDQSSFCCLSDIIFFGKDVCLDRDIQEICLEFRVEKLLECFDPQRGWRHSIALMIEFLEGSSVQFEGGRFSFLELQLRNSLAILQTHLPKSFTGENILREMDSVASFLSSVRHNLDSSNFSSLRSECLSVLRKLNTSLNWLKLPNKESHASVEEFCFRMAKLILCTASSSYKLRSLAMNSITVVVIDEASGIMECESIIPLQVKGTRHLILAGDQYQLSSSTRSKLNEEAGFGRSLMERLGLLSHPKHILKFQYRMHHQISSFPNLKFYEKNMVDAPSIKKRSYGKRYLPGPMFGPYSFIDISCGEVLGDRNSMKNTVELAVILRIIQLLKKACEPCEHKISIGVVSPCSAQVESFKRKLKQKHENDNRFKLDVGLIERFQGREVDVMIISTAASQSKSDELMKFTNRMNVALTRSRHSLWILGDGKSLCDAGSLWEVLIVDAKARQCFFYAEEDKALAKVILEVKSELNLLDDLLSGDSTLFRNAKWKILFSNDFRKSFEKIESLETKNLVLFMLSKISSGWRPKRSFTAAAISGSSHSNIFRQFTVGNLHLICTIDVVRQSGNIQALKVWDIVQFHDIANLVKRLDGIMRTYTKDFLQLCEAKCVDRGLEFPMTWPSMSNIVRYKSWSGTDGGNCYVENAKVRESLMLMKFYSLSSGVVNNFLSGCDGGELGLSFELTEQEKEAVSFEKSSFILGRSGTGKTTVLTMKLFQNEQNYHLACKGFHDFTRKPSVKARLAREASNGEVDIMRQLFVTFNPKLCYAVKQHVSELKRFMCSGNSSSQSSSMHLDDIVSTTMLGDIPDSFIGLPPEKYPLMITFHKFLMMLDGTVGTSFFRRFSAVKRIWDGETSALRSVALETFIRSKEVTYDIFCSSYWPRFSKKLTKNLDPSIAFTQIMSVIKGGLRADVRDGKLSRKEYLFLGEKRSTLDVAKRHQIYSIFEKYEKEKLVNENFDLADFVFDIHRRLQVEGYKGDEIDYVYIDEVQDLSMQQISLFKYVCKNVAEGFVFAGDTAQAIAKGVSFRFEDIRFLFFKEFLQGSRTGRHEKGKISKILRLSQNFRTHDGILKVAQSVINLLYHFFPSSIDFLDPETSLLTGDPPTLLETDIGADAIKTIFGKSRDGGNIVGFGAEQVILVRDECVRKKVSDIVGKNALVLTIVESKGLEFEDVLLYDFFSSCRFKNQWRIIFGYMKEKDILRSLLSEHYASFNPEIHAVLCSELKQLYVAITRTKQRLWICESFGFEQPMFSYWEKLMLVERRRLDASLAKEMQVGSTQDEWRARGIKLFYENNFRMAKMCFMNARDSYWETLAEASELRANADRIRAPTSERMQLLKKAAELFHTIGKAEIAAECFYEIKEYKAAGDVYLQLNLEKAGECYYLAKQFALAAEVYDKVRLPSKCLSTCTAGKLFQRGLQFLDKWKRENVAFPMENIILDFLRRGSLHFFRLKDERMMMECLNRLLLLETECGNFVEAAKIARLKQDPVLEVDLLEMAACYRESSMVILGHAFSNELYLHESKQESFIHKDELIKRAISTAQKQSDDFYSFVCLEADFLSHEESSLSEMETYLAASQRQRSLRSQLLASGRILDVHIHSFPEKYEWDETSVSKELIKVTVDGLIYTWNFWMNKVVKLRDWCLGTLAGRDLKIYKEFSLDYFGLWEHPRDQLNSGYIVLNPDAKWLPQRESFKFISSQEFASAASRHWARELLSVGMEIIETLKSIHVCLTKKNAPAFCQTVTLLGIFEVAKFLENHGDTIKQSVQQSSENVFNNVFNIDWKKSTSKDMVSLRRNESYLKMAKEAILTNGQIGRSVMLMLGSRKGTTELSDNIVRSVKAKPSWKKVFQKLKIMSDSDEVLDDQSRFLRFNAAVVVETFCTDWRKERDYPSPACFLYLLERLLILACCSQGYVFTTRSSCVEWLIYEKWSASSNGSRPRDLEGVEDIHISLAWIVHELLLYPKDLKDWSYKSNEEYCYPVLVLRLIILFSLICVNFRGHFAVLYDLLDCAEITSELPRPFLEALLPGRWNEYFVEALADAFKKIENPLVIVSLASNFSECKCRDAIFLNLNMNEFSEGILTEVLFPEMQKRTVRGETLVPVENNAHLWRVFRSLEELESLRRCITSFPIIKVELQKLFDLLSISISRVLVGSTEDESLIIESESMLIELKELSSLLDICQPDMEARLPRIAQISTSLGLRRRKLDSFLHAVLSQKLKLDSTIKDDENSMEYGGVVVQR